MAATMVESKACLNYGRNEQNFIKEEDEEEESEDDETNFLPAPAAWFEDSSSNLDHDEQQQQQQKIPTTASSSEAAAITEPALETNNIATEARAAARSSLPTDHSIAHGNSNKNNIPTQQQQRSAVGNPLPSPSWAEISSQLLPNAARELLASSLQHILHTARLSYHNTRWHRKYSDLGNNAGGYFRPSHLSKLPPFSSLSWVDRQLVLEWRTYFPCKDDKIDGSKDLENEEDIDFDRARNLVPMPLPRPTWEKAEVCYECHKTFGPTRLRHHCRLCGKSFCQLHSSTEHKLPHLGYNCDVPERVCDCCKILLLEQNLAERIAWRLARCRDYREGNLTPYFETGVDTLEEAAMRITRAAIQMAKSIPLGAQATVAVETVDVLRKYGFNGVYTIMLRQEFLAAADLLCKACGINQKTWPLSVHELSAAIFYALAQHRAMRGMHPDREHFIHSICEQDSPAANKKSCGAPYVEDSAIDEMGMHHAEASISNLISGPESPIEPAHELPFEPVCDAVADTTLASIIFYAPMAINFIYVEKEVDMQVLAAQQGWRLLYAYLDQEEKVKKESDRPASAVFVHEERKIICVTIRGTATIHDVVTDIRQMPVPFPDVDPDNTEDDWTTVFGGQGIAVGGMASAAVNLYTEHIDSILFFARQGYRIRLCGHSLGGGVATLIGLLINRHMKRESELAQNCARGPEEAELPKRSVNFSDEQLLRVYAYGTPSCVDAKLSEFVETFVTTVVLHDDVVPRLTPTSCRALLKHLLRVRGTWVKDHLTDDLKAITERAKTAWAPRWRGGFTLAASKSSSSIKRYCRKQIQYGTKKVLLVKGTLVVGSAEERCTSLEESARARRHDSETNWDTTQSDRNSQQNQAQQSHLLMDYMGGVDNRTQGFLVDGDEFFDADNDLLEHESDEREGQELETCLHTDALGCGRKSGGPTDTVSGISFDEVDNCGPGIGIETPGAVVLEETPLPRMFIPGKIIHIYSHRGVYKAAYVPRTFREIRRISMAGNMLSDHRANAYYEALLEVRSARIAEENPPEWTAFDEDDTCSCCASRFTWASTSDSKAQEARDKHNCRSCGTLVCDPCSKNRIPLPSIGLTVPVRICDRCYNDIAGISNNPVGMTDSFTAESGSPKSEEPPIVPSDRPERRRGRRSSVVDELASRVQTSHSPVTEYSG